MDYEQELSRLESSTKELVEDFVREALSVDFSDTGGRSLLRPIGGPRVESLRRRLGRPSVTLAAIDGSSAVKQFGGLVFVAVASVSLIYELVFSEPIWMEKWPERSCEYSAVLPFLALQREPPSQEEGQSYFEALALGTMKLLEYFAAIDALDLADIVLMDGSLSTEYQTCVLKALEDKTYMGSKLIGLQTPLGALDQYDLHINLHRAACLANNGQADPLCPIFEAEKSGGTVRLKQPAPQALREAASSYPNKISLEGETLRLSDEALTSWKRLVDVTERFKGFFAQTQKSPPKLGLDETTLLRAYTFIRLLLKASEKRRLLISLAKDSSATGLQQLALAKENPKIPDKLALEVYSALKAPHSLSEPWRTLEYDPLARRDGPSTPKALSRFYAQLFVEGEVRSDVVACEWLRYSGGQTEEEAELVAQLLLALSQPTCSIPEALGHCYPLFEVDKHVKHMAHELIGVAEGYTVMLQADPAYQEYFSIIKPFRQKRAEFERGRRGSRRRP